MNQNDIHNQTRSQEPQTKRYMVIVPQEFVQVFYVEAQSANEAMQLVHDGPEDAEERGVDISWSDSSFIQDRETKLWHVEQVG